MLAGHWAVPTPDPAARGSLSLADLSLTPSLVAEALPGEISLPRLSADLGAAGNPPQWIVLAPYDLDSRAMDALLAAMHADAPADPSGAGRAVIEAYDRGQAQQFLSRLRQSEPRGSPTRVVILRHVRTRDRPAPAERPRPGTRQWEADLNRLIGPRVALHESVRAAGQRLPLAQFTAIVERSRGADELTARLARTLLGNVPPKTTVLIGLAALLGYHHPRFASLAPVLDACGTLPWWIELGGGWRRLDPGWRRGVLVACREAGPPQVATVGRLAGELVEDGAVPAAIELCLDAGYPGTAADLLDGLGPGLLAAGSTLAVRRWLGRLPWGERFRHRRLAAQARAISRTPGTSAPTVRVQSPPEPTTEPPAGRATPADLEARLFGPLEVRLQGRPVEHWHGRKGPLLLAYLLLRRLEPPIARDALATVFWPDASPDAARNRLHVTLHALRADLQTAAPVPVIQFGGGYRINPDLKVVLDTEQFDAAARTAATARALPAALRAYRSAVEQYRGDLLGDFPFEDWTVLPREHYRARRLDLLGRMAQAAFDSGQYAQTLEIGRQLLALDFFREDLHRLLMRAHTRMGRPQAAVQQFETCIDQLRRELGMAPADETVDLYERIRARSPV